MFGFGQKERYCPICGLTATDTNLSRFGQQFCSQQHQDLFVGAERERQLKSASEQNQQRRHGCGG